MDRVAWQATVHEGARVRNDLATKPPQYQLIGMPMKETSIQLNYSTLIFLPITWYISPKDYWFNKNNLKKTVIINKMWCVHTKRKEFLSYTIQINLQNIMWSEISQSQKDKEKLFPCCCGAARRRRLGCMQDSAPPVTGNPPPWPRKALLLEV